jgi:hypothetical protein
VTPYVTNEALMATLRLVVSAPEGRRAEKRADWLGPPFRFQMSTNELNAD